MYFVEVEELPKKASRTGAKGELKSKLEQFMGMRVKIAKLVLDDCDYVCPTSAYCSFTDACEYWALPIDVKMRNGEVYLVRTDM